MVQLQLIGRYCGSPKAMQENVLIQVLTSPESRPYCGTWVWMQSDLKYTGMICHTTSSFARFAMWTGPSLKSTRITTSSSRLLSSSRSRSTVLSLASSTAPARASPTEKTPPGPQGIDMIAAIAGTLGGVGSFVAGALALYKYLQKRKAKEKTTISA